MLTITIELKLKRTAAAAIATSKYSSTHSHYDALDININPLMGVVSSMCFSYSM